MPSPVIKQAPRDAAIVTIATAIDTASPGDDIALGVVQKAYREAKALREGAERDAARIMSDARQAGLAQGRAEFDEALRRLERLAEEFVSAIARAADDAAPLLADLAVEIAARILRTEITIRPDAIAALVSEAVARVAGALEITVRLPPDDMAVLEAHRGHIEEIAGGQVRFVADDRIDAGCLIESSTGQIDARVATQLREMRRVLRETLDG